VKSWIDVPGESTVLDGEGAILLDLERADPGALYDAGWAPPERVVVKADDGTTDLYGLLHLPLDFDASRRYPILDDIYPGPQVNHASVGFPGAGPCAAPL